jgi:hypothetical protein
MARRLPIVRLGTAISSLEKKASRGPVEDGTDKAAKGPLKEEILSAVGAEAATVLKQIRAEVAAAEGAEDDGAEAEGDGWLVGRLEDLMFEALQRLESNVGCLITDRFGEAAVDDCGEAIERLMAAAYDQLVVAFTAICPNELLQANTTNPIDDIVGSAGYPFPTSN